VPFVLTCLMYVVSVGSILTLFATIIWIVYWLLKTLVLWLIAEPETDPSRSPRFRPQDFEHLKRAGQ
jgi:hypothetical protein